MSNHTDIDFDNKENNMLSQGLDNVNLNLSSNLEALGTSAGNGGKRPNKTRSSLDNMHASQNSNMVSQHI